MWTNSRFGGIGPDGKEEKMLISVILVGFVLWLFSKCVGLALRMTWGLAKLAGVVLMTVAMTIFSVVVSGKLGMEGVIDFFTYLPYNFTIALPIQMLIVAPVSLRIARWGASLFSGSAAERA